MLSEVVSRAPCARPGAISGQCNATSQQLKSRGSEGRYYRPLKMCCQEKRLLLASERANYDRTRGFLNKLPITIAVNAQTPRLFSHFPGRKFA